MSEEIFEVGDVVYHDRTGDERVVARVSKTGLLAFGEPPFNSGSYVGAWNYTHDRRQGKTKALQSAVAALPYCEETLRRAQAALEKERARIARLTAELEEMD
jgi:hypothetical protein